MNPNDDVVYCSLRLGTFDKLHTSRSSRLICYDDGFHHLPPGAEMSSFANFFAGERNKTAKIDGPMTFGYGNNATDPAHKNHDPNEA
jgi:hypothetical protein